MSSCVAVCLILGWFAGCETATSTSNGYSRPASGVSTFESNKGKDPIPETLFSVSRILIAQGRDEEAEPILRRITSEHQSFVPAYNKLAEIQMRDQRLGEALQTLQAGLEEDPENVTLLNNLGMCWLLRERYDTALEVFTEAASLSPDDARLRANMAVAIGMQGRYDEAFALYEQVVSRAEAHYNLGVLAQAREDYGRAGDEFAQAERINPSVVRRRFEQ